MKGDRMQLDELLGKLFEECHLDEGSDPTNGQVELVRLLVVTIGRNPLDLAVNLVPICLENLYFGMASDNLVAESKLYETNFLIKKFHLLDEIL
jgi:hypothetical protein